MPDDMIDAILVPGIGEEGSHWSRDEYGLMIRRPDGRPMSDRECQMILDHLRIRAEAQRMRIT